jgi:hypothetical protein
MIAFSVLCSASSYFPSNRLISNGTANDTVRKMVTLPVEVGNYSARFSFGTENDTTSLILSMQRDWTYVMGSECQTCPSKPYHYNKSTSFKEANYSKSDINIGYEEQKLTLTGFAAQDTMCVS